MTSLCDADVEGRSLVDYLGSSVTAQAPSSQSVTKEVLSRQSQLFYHRLRDAAQREAINSLVRSPIRDAKICPPAKQSTNASLFLRPGEVGTATTCLSGINRRLFGDVLEGNGWRTLKSMHTALFSRTTSAEHRLLHGPKSIGVPTERESHHNHYAHHCGIGQHEYVGEYPKDPTSSPQHAVGLCRVVPSSRADVESREVPFHLSEEEKSIIIAVLSSVIWCGGPQQSRLYDNDLDFLMKFGHRRRAVHMCLEQMIARRNEWNQLAAPSVEWSMVTSVFRHCLSLPRWVPSSVRVSQDGERASGLSRRKAEVLYKRLNVIH